MAILGNVSTQECKTMRNVKVEKQTLDAMIYPEVLISYTSFPLVLVVGALHKEGNPTQGLYSPVQSRRGWPMGSPYYTSGSPPNLSRNFPAASTW